MFALQDVVIKDMSQGYPVHQIIVLRAAVGLPILLGIVLMTSKYPFLGTHRVGLMLLRGGLMFFAFVLFYLALSTLPLTMVTALFYTGPFFMLLFSIVLLGEKVSLSQWLAVTTGFLGALIILRPDRSGFNLIGMLPILAAMFYAGCQVLTRHKSLQATPAVMTFYANLSFIVLGLVVAITASFFSADNQTPLPTQFLLRDWVFPDINDAMLFILIGVIMCIGFLISTYAYKTTRVNRLAPFEYSMLIWVIVLSYIVWSEIPSRNVIIGSVIIGASGLYVLRYETREEK